MTTNEPITVELEAEIVEPRSFVKYERLYNLGNYENEKIGFSVPMLDGETPDEALKRVQTMVTSQRKDEQDSSRAEYSLDQYRSLEADIKRRIKALHELGKAQYQRYQEIGAKIALLGAQVPELSPWRELPLTDEELKSQLDYIAGTPVSDEVDPDGDFDDD